MAEEGRVVVPAELPVGERMRTVLATLLDPAPARRFGSARAAREALLTSTALALVPGGGAALARLEPTPRTLAPGTAADTLFRRVAYSPWRLMNSTVQTDERVDVPTIVITAFFSVVTLGILPLTFYWLARARRKRLRRFFRDGVPGVARIVDFREDQIGFGEKLMRVRYEFDADGGTHRGGDQVHPTIADRLRAGDPIEILYLPGRNYDSVIIGGH
jgi:hypothetical protein